MKIDGIDYRTIWLRDDGAAVQIIDQTRLPHELIIADLVDVHDFERAIRTMQVRGAPLIGVTAAYGLAMALRADAGDEHLARACETLLSARPTAVNLGWAVGRVRETVAGLPPHARAEAALALAHEICEDDVRNCARIGEHGREVIASLARAGDGPVNVLTHCNAGWLATVDWGTALAPVFKAHDAGLDVHVWVDETRPRNQGALTAWELNAHDVPHTVIVDNAGGHLMQHGLVDVCFVGTDRTTGSGDVCNKIGTYLKALAARDNNVPFYVCAPSSSIDFALDDGIGGVPIEQRDDEEVTFVHGRDPRGAPGSVAPYAPGSPVRNDAFDVTPARLVTGLVTERGIAAANRDALEALFPERRRQ